MEEKRYSSHVEEFQIIYVDTPPSRRWSLSPPLLGITFPEWLPSKKYNVKCGRERVILQWRNLTNTTSATQSGTTSTVIS